MDGHLTVRCCLGSKSVRAEGARPPLGSHPEPCCFCCILLIESITEPAQTQWRGLHMGVNTGGCSVEGPLWRLTGTVLRILQVYDMDLVHVVEPILHPNPDHKVLSGNWQCLAHLCP